MSVTQEDGGRLNAFAKEPKMEVITPNDSDKNGSRILAFAGIVFIIGLIVLSMTMS